MLEKPIVFDGFNNDENIYFMINRGLYNCLKSFARNDPYTFIGTCFKQFLFVINY